MSTDIDFATYTGEVQTRDGREARIICRDSRAHCDGVSFPIVSEIRSPHVYEFLTHSKSGRAMLGQESRSDLIPKKTKKKISVWVNMYRMPNGLIGRGQQNRQDEVICKAYANVDAPDNWVYLGTIELTGEIEI